MADILTSKLLNFPVPAEDKRVWYTWGPVLGAYEPLGVELLRDTKNGNWFIITAKGTSCETVPCYVTRLATDDNVISKARALADSERVAAGLNTKEELKASRVMLFMEWLMTMLKRHA